MALENIVGAQARATLADRVRLRPRARLRILVRAARVAAVRRARIWRRRSCRSTSASSWGSCSCSRSRFRRSRWCFKHVVAERMGTIILSAFVAHTAWHWMLDRGAVLEPVPRSSCRRSTPALAGERAARPDAAAHRRRRRRGRMFELYRPARCAARQARSGPRVRAPTRTDATLVYEERGGRRPCLACMLAVASRPAPQRADDEDDNGTTGSPRRQAPPGPVDARAASTRTSRPVAGQGRVRAEAAGPATRRRRTPARPSPSGGAGSICLISSRSSARECPRTIRGAWRRKTWPTSWRTCSR